MSQTIIKKPWGREVILTENTLPYTGKILYIKQGQRFSLQYHDQKTETLILIQGQALIETGPSTDKLALQPMIPFSGYTIQPTTIHRITAKTDCYVMEVSTPETGTTYRLQDDFSRTNEDQQVRSLPNRGWQQ